MNSKLKGLLLMLAAVVTVAPSVQAQTYTDLNSTDRFTASGYEQDKNFGRSDSIQSRHKEIPRGMKVWTIDNRFGDRTAAEPDTLSYMYMNTIFTSGLYGEYNTLGNAGTPRINRIFIDRHDPGDFIFTGPYDFFITRPSHFHFTSTLSPITNLSYNTCGNRTNGEDHLKALFAVNAGKQLGLGMKFDYLYARGYYSNQNTSHFNYTLYGSYLGDRYQAHLLASAYHQKVAENGGIANDEYITRPERFNEHYAENELPTMLQQNWNRNDHQHVFFNHRYSVGFRRKVPMTAEEIEARKFAIRAQRENQAEQARLKAARQAKRNGEEFDEKEYERRHQPNSGRPDNARIAGDEPAGKGQKPAAGRITVDNPAQADSLLAAERQAKQAEEADQWTKTEYVPVTSFIHTATFDNYRRIYQAYDTPVDYYLNDYGSGVGAVKGDSIYDRTRHWRLKNTLAVALLEGFNKWVKAGLKAFASFEVRHYALPNADRGYDTFNQKAFNIGGQLSKAQGRTLHYKVTADVSLVGDDVGQFTVDADADVNFRLFGDTVQLAAKAFLHYLDPPYFLEKYQSRHYWWDNMSKFSRVTHSRIEGLFTVKRTNTQLRVAVDNIKNYTYINQSYIREPLEYRYLQKGTSLTVEQAPDAVNLLTLQLKQKLSLGIVHWENVLTWQRTSNENVLAVPALNIYSNLFLRFKIARVLDCDFGADLRMFTKYYAPEYNPAIGQYVVQGDETQRIKTGGYPIVNVYANFFLKHARFFVMYSHVNYAEGNNYIFTPHYPENRGVFRFGVSWNFFN